MASSSRTRRGTAATLTVVLLAAMLVLALLPPSAGASEPEDGEVVEEQTAIREAAPWETGNEGMALWAWPEGKRIYQLDNGSLPGLSRIKAYDAHTLAEVASAQLSPPTWGSLSNNEYMSAAGRHHVAAVDRVAGRVFVAYRTRILNVDHGINPSNPAASQSMLTKDLCPGSGVLTDPGCVGGIHVLDALTLEPAGLIQLDLPSAESPRVQPIPRAMAYAPPDEERGWGGRVLMVVEEIANGPLETSPLPALVSATQNAIPRRNSGNIAYAIALDPDNMRQEWAVRLEGCRNAREPRDWSMAREGDPATVFRSGGSDPALYVGCHGNASQQGVVVRVPLDEEGFPAALPLQAGDPVQELDPAAQDGGLSALVSPAPRQEVFPGPDQVRVIMSDPASRRILMRVDDSGEVWWVFDGHANQFIGTIGIGNYLQGHTSARLDEDTGRLYVLAATPAEAHIDAPGGLYVADIRHNPLPQALHYSEFADPKRNGTAEKGAGQTMSVLPRGDTTATRIFAARSSLDGNQFRVLMDESAVAADSETDDAAVVRTLDIDEAPEVTDATFDGTARGFGFRTILIGGLEGATRAGPADPIGAVRGAREFETSLEVWHGAFEGGRFVAQSTIDPVMDRLPPPDPCADAQRELVVAFVGPETPATVDATGARGSAQPVLADVRTREDIGKPVTRCAPMDWQELWRTGMVSQPPVSEPGVPWPFEDGRSSCTATDEREQDSWNDPVAGMFASQVECSENKVGGWGQARGANLDGVSVANTLSSFQIYRDPDRGLVARVESIARGIDIGGIVKIDTIRGVAESWANGRHAEFVDPELERKLGLGGTDESAASEDGDPADGKAEPGEGNEEANPFNCDSARPAGTCFQRHLFGVTVTNPGSGEVVYRCGPCGDEDELIEAMNRAFGAYGYARFREPDPVLARGADDGYIAAVTKKDKERFADIVLNSDLLKTIVPMLEVIRYAPHNRPSDPKGTFPYTTGTPPRGRQLYQFAAVEVSSTYSIQCLLQYDEATNTCAPRLDQPASLTVELIDGEGAPLAGGAFELHADGDADGVLGLADELVPDGACVTADDGIGTCRFENLEPGPYLLSQVAAPPGYAAAVEPFAVPLSAGDAQTVTFTNASSVSKINVAVTDPDGAPLAGASFGVFPDGGDGTVDPSAQPVATCTTDSAGRCTIEVEPGAYVLRQFEVPAGFAPIGDIPFEITSGGQTADVGLVLAAGGDGQPVPGGGSETSAPPAASPVMHFEPGTAPSGPIMSSGPSLDHGPGVDLPAVAERVGNTIVRVIRAPAAAMRLAARSPMEATGFAAVFALFALAALAVQRRQMLTALLTTPGVNPLPPAPSFPGRGPSPGSPPSGGQRGPAPSGSNGRGGPRRPDGQGGSPGLAAFHAPDQTSGTMGAGGTATALRERPSITGSDDARADKPASRLLEPPPLVAGAAPTSTERVNARVVVATANPALAALVSHRLAAADRCEHQATVTALADLRAVLAEMEPDVLVVDLALPTGGAYDVGDLMPKLYAPERTIGLIPPSRSSQALTVRGYTLRLAGLLVAEEDLGNGQLALAVRAVAAGKMFYGPAVQVELAEYWRGRPRRRVARGAAGLTKRQLQIARLAASGMSRAEIAQQVHLSPDTVKSHLRTIRARLGVTDPRDAAQLRRHLEEAGGLDDD